MRLKWLICIFPMLVGSALYAESKASHPNDTIPFVTYKVTGGAAHPGDGGATITSGMSNRYAAISSGDQAVKLVADNIPVDDLENLLVKLRASICRSTGSADIRVWLSVDADGKILGVGAGAQSGLEVTFQPLAQNLWVEAA